MVSAPQQRKGWLLAALLGAIFLGNVDIAVVNIATPSIHAHLQASGAELEFIVSGYTLAYGVFLVTSARLGDICGYRQMFLLGLGIFTLASLGCGLAPNAVFLVGARIIQGTGAALMVAQVLTGIQLNFQGNARAHALGVYTIVLSGSAVIGQVLGGVLVSANLFGTQWRPIFLINVPIGLILMIMAAYFLPADQKQQAQRLDLRGVAALSISLLLLVIPLILGQEEGWPTWSWICLLASLPAFAVFIALESRLIARGGSPLINLKLLTRPLIFWGLICLAFANIVYSSMLFVLALYLQQGLGQSPTYSGLILVPWVAAFGLSGPVVGRLSARGRLLAAPIGMFTLAASYASIGMSVLAGATGGPLLIILLGLGGLSMGLQFTALISHLTNSVDSRDAADLSGLYNAIFRIAGVLGVAAFGTLYLALAPHPGREVAIHAFTIVMFALAASSLLATVAAYLSIRQPARPVDSEVAKQEEQSEAASEAELPTTSF
ncbi:MAG TPA: MFS transporter [Ktedonosporobacter sp.]|nr:MFS transporter [Ktedonosporobacter sp.]